MLYLITRHYILYFITRNYMLYFITRHYILYFITRHYILYFITRNYILYSIARNYILYLQQEITYYTYNKKLHTILYNKKLHTILYNKKLHTILITRHYTESIHKPIVFYEIQPNCYFIHQHIKPLNNKYDLLIGYFLLTYLVLMKVQQLQSLQLIRQSFIICHLSSCKKSFCDNSQYRSITKNHLQII